MSTASPIQMLSPKDLGRAIGVSESTLKRWADAGLIQVVRTPGGHRRIPLHEAVRFIRERHLSIQAPEVLGLGEVSAIVSDETAQAEHFFRALSEGHAADAWGLLFSRFVAGASVATLCDGLIADAMHKLGELWRHDKEGIWVEHRATSICIHALHQLRSLIPPVEVGAPVAVGASPAFDVYVLPTFMAATVMAEAGWHGIDFGADMPLPLLAQAARDADASLVWVAVTSEPPEPTFARELSHLADELGARGTALVLGGQALPGMPLPCGEHVLTGNRMADLDAFARGMRHAHREDRVVSHGGGKGE